MTRLNKLLASAVLAGATVLGGLDAVQAQTVYHRGNTGEPETLDQHRTATSYEAHILRDLYEGLLAHDAEANVIPGVAESWTVSDDGTVYTFTLRNDARWSNGDPVTAGDFVFSLRRIMDPETAATYANILYPIGNAEAINQGERDPAELAVAALDDRTLQITLTAPTPYFLELLTHQTGLPVHPGSVAEHGDAFAQPGTMVSNGAYRLVEWVPNAQIILERNPYFHDAENVSIDRVVFYPTEDRSAALRAFRAGELHTNNDVPHDQIRWLQENMPENFRSAAYLGTYFYALNHEDEVLSDPDVRRALSMAIDRAFIVEEIVDGGYAAAYSFVPPGIGNYGEPAYAEYRGEPMAERVDEAIELMEAAGFGPGNPVTLELRYNTSENHRKVAVAIADMWAPLGVSVELFNTDVATHYAHLRDRGDFDVARAVWIGDYSDPQNFLFMVESDNTGFNYARYENPEYDALMDLAAATVDLEDRAAILYEAEEIFMEDLPFIPIYHYVSLNLVADTVQGWQDNIQNIHPTRFLRIAED